MTGVDKLPPQWKWSSIHEVAETTFGQSPPSSSYNRDGRGLPFFQGKAEFGEKHPVVEKWCTKPTREADAGDILVSIRAPVGPTNVADRRCAIGRGLAAVRSLIEPDFIRFWLQISEQALAGKGTGTTFGAISKGVLNDHEIPVAPIAEQRRIVEKVETLFAHLDKGEEVLRQVQKLLARYRQSVLKAAVTGRLTEDWRAENAHRLEHGRDLLERILQAQRKSWQGRGKYKEPAEPDTADLPELPEGWVWATLPMLGEFGRGKSKHRPRNDPRLYSDGKYPFLQTGRVRNSAGRISEYDTLYNDLGLAQSKLWPKGSICITIAANIAESGILEIDACFPDSVVGLVPHSEINGEYVESFIRTAKENLDRYAPATAQRNINLEILNGVAVPLPPSTEQTEIQNRIDAAFSTIRFAEQVCETELARSTALRQSILKEAFAGRLVPQDPTDEPAADLLARIRQTRTASPKKPQRKARP